MGKINLTIGKIAMWVSGILMLFGVFGNWYGVKDGESVSVFTMWDMTSMANGMSGGFGGEQIKFGAGAILSLLAILIILTVIVLITLDFVGKKFKYYTYTVMGTGALAVITAIIGIIAKPKYDMKEIPDELKFNISFGLIMLIIAGVIFAVSAIIDEKLGSKANISIDLSSVGTTNGNGGQAKTFCPQCGAEVSNGAPFCGSCGNKMN